jgi:hypothetical protein
MLSVLHIDGGFDWQMNCIDRDLQPPLSHDRLTPVTRRDREGFI